MSETVDASGVQSLLEARRPAIDKVIAAMLNELSALHLDQAGEGLNAPLKNLEVRKDPFDGAETLYGEWRDAHNQMVGSLQLMGSGKVFAEFDVVQPHPQKPKWFIEAVAAWGQIHQLKTELRLIPALGD
jgi:hypothetical protein